MLVSAAADRSFREAVERGRRPRPEFLYLESVHGVDILDWSRLRPRPSQRTSSASLLHALAALRRAARYDVILSDGEHVGIPLAIGLCGLRKDVPHVVIGHHVSTPSKARYFRVLRAHAGMSRILVHSHRQAEIATADLGIPASRVAEIPYFADSDFWTARRPPGDGVILTVGREHRDFTTLAEACGDLPVTVSVAVGSLHSPAATWSAPGRWPANFRVEPALRHELLRERYEAASIVVIPVLETDFQAGVTSVLEAMSMGRPVITTATAGRAPAVRHGEDGLLVPPGDRAALRRAVGHLLGDPGERRRLGEAARRSVLERYRLEVFGDALAAHLDEVAGGLRSASRPAGSPAGAPR